MRNLLVIQILQSYYHCYKTVTVGTAVSLSHKKVFSEDNAFKIQSQESAFLLHLKKLSIEVKQQTIVLSSYHNIWRMI